MANPTDQSITAALATLREKRRRIDLAIAALEALESDFQDDENALEPAPEPRVRIRQRSVSYVGMTLIEAAKSYLAQNGHQTTQEIADALIRGGFTSESENFRNVVSTMLHRAANDPGSGIASVGRATWAFVEAT